MFLSFYLFLKAWKSEKLKNCVIFGILSGVSTTMMGLIWGGDVFIYITIALASLIAFILNKVHKPCLFWFDAHYSEGITAKGEKETPIVEELKYIITHPIEGNVILIDDARLFTGKNDYPGIEEIRELILSRYPEYVFNVKDDIIRIHNKGRL